MSQKIVVADDFTGAAEMAGIAWRYNLDTVLHLLPDMRSPEAEMVVMCSDSRSMSKEDARKTTARYAQAVSKQKPALVYKKIDSVLRGYVIEEVKVMMSCFGKEKALILGANPSLGRTIVNGRYYVHGVPIHETSFASDPEFPVNSSSVVDMLGVQQGDVQMLKYSEPLPDNGIVIGETSSSDDVTAWAERVNNDDWLLVGAGDFFAAILNKQFVPDSKSGTAIRLPHLFVRGTAFPKYRKWVEAIAKQFDGVVYLPPDAGQSAWMKQAQVILERRKKLLIAYAAGSIPSGMPARTLRNNMARAVKRLVRRDSIAELFIEGGATAASVLQALEIKSLTVLQEYRPGVVKMQAGNLHITVKPGSYELPAEIEQFYCTE